MSGPLSRLSRLSTFATAERASAASRTATNDPRNVAISQLLRGRVSNFATVRSSLPVLQAVEVMAQQNAGHLIVTRGGETPLGDTMATAPGAGNPARRVSSVAALKGIVTERDVMLAVPRLVKEREDLLVSDIMSSHPQTVEASATVGDCMELMTSKGFRHIPVTDSGELVGVLSIRDLVQRLVDDHKDVVTDLNVQLGRLSALGVDLDGEPSKAHANGSASSSWWR